MQECSIEKAFSSFKPESCIFVISVDAAGKPSGMIAGWNMKCSFDPPLLAISLQKKGYTHELINNSKEFVIAVPNKGLEEEINFFGTTHGDEVDKFSATGIKMSQSKYIEPPLLTDATINFECKLEKKVVVGDHILYIGRVVATYINEGKKVLMNMGQGNDERIFEEF